jgi:acyl-coenzyme A thioesterase PaaI-like protein
MHGAALIIPQLHVPGCSQLRASILATWADHLMGLLASQVMMPRVPATLELDVHLYRPAPGAGTVEGRARLLKAGRSVLSACVDFFVDGEPLGVSAGSFMLAGDPNVRLPSTLSFEAAAPRAATLSEPIAERAGCERKQAGVAELPRRHDGLNSSNTINGGLLALVAEEALLSLAPHTTLCSLALRYLRPARIGPAVARATLRGGLGLVEVSDAGSEDRLAVTATARLFGVAGDAR